MAIAQKGNLLSRLPFDLSGQSRAVEFFKAMVFKPLPTLLLLALVGCSSVTEKPVAVSPSPSPSVLPSPAPQPINVTLQVRAAKQGTSQVVVQGQTNLPDGFVMTIGACRYHLEQKDNKRHCLTTANPEDQKVPVSQGKFNATFTVPSSTKLKSELTVFARNFQEPGLVNSKIENSVEVSIVGTPFVQSPEILEKIGGQSAKGLQGRYTEQASDKFRVVTFKTRVRM